MKIICKVYQLFLYLLYYITKIMHGINFTFAQNFNRTNKRKGTLFQDRFKSKIIKDERYIITLSAYIHNNPKAIEGYYNCPAEYPYSSLPAYLGLKKDPHKILDEDFIMQMFGRRKSVARKNYSKLMALCNDLLINEEIEFENDKTEYRSGRKILVRDLNPNEIIEYVAKKTNTNPNKIYVKNSRYTTEAKALTVLLMKNLCNFKCVDICETIGNITVGRVSKLCNIGLQLIDDKLEYRDLISIFIKDHVAQNS